MQSRCKANLRSPHGIRDGEYQQIQNTIGNEDNKKIFSEGRPTLAYHCEARQYALMENQETERKRPFL